MALLNVTPYTFYMTSIAGNLQIRIGTQSCYHNLYRVYSAVQILQCSVKFFKNLQLEIPVPTDKLSIDFVKVYF